MLSRMLPITIATAMSLAVSVCAPSAAPATAPSAAPAGPLAGAPLRPDAVTPPPTTPSPDRTASRKKLTFGNPATPPSLVHLPVYTALEFGFFHEVGLEVDIQGLDSAPTALRWAAAGRLDVAGSSAASLIVAIAQGAPLKAIGTYAPRLSVVMTSRPDIRKVEDLRRRKIGVQEMGGFLDIMTRLLLSTAGLTEKDVQYVDVSPAALVSALVQGRIDAAILPIDQYYNATRQKPDLVALARMWEVAPEWWSSAVVASEQQIKKNPNALVDFLTAVVKAQRFMYQERERTIDVGVKYTKQPREVVARTYDELIGGRVWSVNDGMPASALEYTINKLVEMGAIKPDQRPAYQRLVERTMVDKAVQRNGGPLLGDSRWR